ncbi:MAG: extracellular solute-binding protein [Micavibrio sp.]|nr:extracellular solute-binding protein [Micavibrio sp.]
MKIGYILAFGLIFGGIMAYAMSQMDSSEPITPVVDIAPEETVAIKNVPAEKVAVAADPTPDETAATEENSIAETDKNEAFISDAANETPEPQYAISLHGEPKYKLGFEHVAYVNPDAPKGGTLKLSATGGFDSLNPFIVKGVPAAGLNFLRSGFLYESLMQNSWDEPFTLYGILAETIEVPSDKSWVAFNLRSEAKFADGQPITAEDVVWTFNTLLEKGNPFYKAYYANVVKAEATSERRVKFTFNIANNAELPLIVAELVVLPKHYWEGREFNQTSLEPPVGSGPYAIEKVEAGRSITYKRRDDWWGKELPFFKGFYNFDRVQFDYYRDSNVELEAFLGGQYDVRMENMAKLWKTSYDVDAVKKGKIAMEEIENSRPAGMQAFVYNTRRPVFKDPKVREALAYAFDFEWSNSQFAYGDYIRTNSYYENDAMASSGLPEGNELELLERFRGKIPDDVFTQTYYPPRTDMAGGIRANLRTAQKLLENAGYTMGMDGIRAKGDVKLEFEILDSDPQFERWVLPFVQNLQRIGVKANFRVVDSAQYQNRMNEYDFDMTVGAFGQSSSPGNEQREFWGSDKASLPGSRNLIGVKDPVVDQLIEELVQAQSREDLMTHIHALDRILLWNHYVIPMWHYPKWRIAHWSHIKRPDALSGISPLIADTWWYEKAQ